MKVVELLEGKNSDMPMVGSMLLRLHKARSPLKVLITGLRKPLKMGPGSSTRKWQDVPDQEWDITGVRVNKTPNGSFVRVSNTSSEQWFELNPDDDEHLTIKKKDGYWLLTSQDGKGVKL